MGLPMNQFIAIEKQVAETLHIIIIIIIIIGRLSVKIAPNCTSSSALVVTENADRTA